MSELDRSLIIAPGDDIA